ncbi:MAG: hypothetical protein H6752_00295 [Candidatus Omnitrophica bacterium]|nr:hypothetical protein [Candidatus Omnitrophota bacterium]
MLARIIEDNQLHLSGTECRCCLSFCLYGNPLPSNGGIGNIEGDPLFVDPENGDYRLRASSPCIDAGTKVEVATDLAGNPRPIDVAGRGHEGENAYDMGCYEFVLDRADLNSDGFVNGNDLILFQEQWMEEKNP